MELRKLLELKKMSQQELADALDIPRNTVWRWVNGRATPSVDVAKEIAAALGVSEAELLNGPSSPEWRIEAVFKKEEDWEMDKCIDMSASGPNMFLAEVGIKKIALNLVGEPKSEEELDGLWAKLKPQIMKMIEIRDGLNAGLVAATA